MIWEILSSFQSWVEPRLKWVALFAFALVIVVYLGFAVLSRICEAKLKQDKRAQEILEDAQKLNAKPQGEGKVWSI